MKSRILVLLAAAVLAALPAHAQPAPYSVRQTPLVLSYDLDGEAADDDQVITSTLLLDTRSYTITGAQPDICRLIDITVTDADSSISAGVITVTGTDCWDAPLVATFTFAAGGSGVKTLTVASGSRASAAYFKTITTVTNALLTGEDGATDSLKVGYTGNSPKGWPMYGRYVASRSGPRRVDLFETFEQTQVVKNGAATTDITAVAPTTTAPFADIAVGDLLIFNIGGERIPRIVATRADADTITINSGVTLPTTGLGFAWKKLYFSSDPQDGWFSVTGWDTLSVMFQVDANADTGGVVSSVECAMVTVDGAAVPDVIFEEDTATVASAATGTDITSIDLRLKPQYTHCRVGMKFATGDDADGANENIDVVIGLRR